MQLIKHTQMIQNNRSIGDRNEVIKLNNERHVLPFTKNTSCWYRRTNKTGNLRI